MYVLNKPLGVLSTAKDTHGRTTVVALIADTLAGTRERSRLYPVGRLDADSSGLILLTNDGALAHRLTHPSFEVPEDLPRACRWRAGGRRRTAQAARGSASGGRHNRTGACAPRRAECSS